MKFITLLALVAAVGCILATGCVAQPKKDPGNATVSPTNTFTPFVNTTTVPVINVTNTTNATSYECNTRHYRARCVYPSAVIMPESLCRFS